MRRVVRTVLGVSLLIGVLAGAVLLRRVASPSPVSGVPAVVWTAPALPFTLPDRAVFGLPAERPAGMVAPHHLLAAELMARAYARLNPSAYRRVVLISPDHFGQGVGNVHLTAMATATADGVVRAADVPPALAALPGFTPHQLVREHGLHLHLQFIARYLPEVPVLMVAVREGADPTELAAIADGLAATTTLAILSSDFSHELPPRWAAFHDATTITAIAEANPAALDHLETDNRAALRLFVELMARQHSQRFTLWEHANGDTINPAGRYETVTSYIAGAYFPGVPEPKPGLSLTFTGDVMLDRRVYAESKRAGGLDYPFRQIPRLLTGDDFTVINHEGPMTNDPYHAPETEPNNVSFNFDPAYRPFLVAASIEVFGLANNHTLNRGPRGLAETRRLLAETGGLVVGDPNIFAEPLRLSRHGQTATLFAVYDKNETNFAAIGKRIAQTPSNEFTIVLMHWGVEYSERSSPRQQRIAHGLIDAGADAVIGAGPHVVQPIEVYRGRAIFYSLGNFIFDQDWSVPTQRGLVVGLRLEPDRNSYTLQLVTMLDGQVSVPHTKTMVETLAFLTDTFVGPVNLRPAIRTGQLTLQP